MAVIIPSSITVGQTVKLWPKDSTEEWCDVVAPNGQEFKLKVRPKGYVEVWLAQVGAWHYVWSDKDHGMLNVIPKIGPENPPVYELIDGG